jgi:hypothetical protein
MTYRMKLFVVLGSLVVISNGVIAAANYRRCNALLHAEVHRKARANRRHDCGAGRSGGGRCD